MFEYSLVAGLTASGADVYLLHVTTTPSVSYVVRTEGFDCGIMISACHNPYKDNGIKLLTSAPVKNACVQGIACGMRIKNGYQDMVEQAKAEVDDMVAEAAYLNHRQAAADKAAE